MTTRFQTRAKRISSCRCCSDVVQVLKTGGARESQKTPNRLVPTEDISLHSLMGGEVMQVEFIHQNHQTGSVKQTCVCLNESSCSFSLHSEVFIRQEHRLKWRLEANEHPHCSCSPQSTFITGSVSRLRRFGSNNTTGEASNSNRCSTDAVNRWFHSYCSCSRTNNL